MYSLLIIIILGIMTWNVKQGFNLIDERLKDIYATIQNNNKDN